MPNPKRRHSKTRTAKRRTHDALEAGRASASARSATSRSRRTASAPTAATTAAARRGRSTKSSDPARESLNPDPMIWIAVDAMGGDDAPAPRRRRRAGRGARTSISASRSSGRRGAHRRASSPGIPTSIATRVRVVDAPDVVDDGGIAGGGAAPQAGRVDPGRGRIGGARRGGGAVQRRAHRRDGDGGARRVRHAAGRRSAGAGRDDSDARSGPAVLLDVGASVECRPQHLLQFAVMGSVYARVAFGIERRGSGCCRSARRRPRATS